VVTQVEKKENVEIKELDERKINEQDEKLNP